MRVALRSCFTSSLSLYSSLIHSIMWLSESGVVIKDDVSIAASPYTLRIRPLTSMSSYCYVDCSWAMTIRQKGKKRCWTCGTWYSHMVSHYSTDQASPCLSSESKRDREWSRMNGRRYKWSRISTPYTAPTCHQSGWNFLFCISCRFDTRVLGWGVHVVDSSWWRILFHTP